MNRRGSRRKRCVYCGAGNGMAALACRSCGRPFPAFRALLAGAVFAGAVLFLAAIFLLVD